VQQASRHVGSDVAGQESCRSREFLDSAVRGNGGLGSARDLGDRLVLLLGCKRIRFVNPLRVDATGQDHVDGHAGCTTPDEAMVMIRPHLRARIPGRNGL
jgi:hypothetical protein